MLPFVSVLADSDGWGHMDGWGGGWMWLWGLPVMALLVVSLVWLVRAVSSSGPPGVSPPRDPHERAREILAERYARGELTTEEYRDRVSELR